VRSWWLSRSFKVRLTLWYAAVMCLVLASFAFAVYEIVEHRLAAELDRQLRIDFDWVEAQLDMDADGNVRWLVRGAHGDEGFARLAAWFEVWSEEGQLLFRHWPVSETQIKRGLPAPLTAALRFHDVEIEDELHVRLMERPARLQGRGVIVRLFRDQSSMRQTLRQIVEVFVLALPFAVLLASLGGYLLARRSLGPVAAMAAQAKQITSESLEARLPNPNPADEFGQLATVINETLQRLEGSFTELKRFTADASHELRTPLTALRTVGEVALRQEGDVTDLREAIGSMLEEAQRLNELIESLLELARMQSSGTVMNLQAVNIGELFAEVRESLAVLAAEKQQLLEFGAAADISVAADRVLLRQVLLNIVHNAIRYSPRSSRIEVRAKQSEAEIAIEVSDDGPGIPAEHHHKIFDRFYRIDKARSRAAGGHGLGLAIAMSSVERQHGTIELQSEPGAGSVFRIRFPQRNHS
jgi:heavy metal sensor kinase